VARDAGAPDISAAMLHAVMGEPVPGFEEPPMRATVPDDPLTLREGQVLVLLERGFAVKQIAAALGISDSTVRSYVRNVFAKLDVHSTTAAIYAARTSGLLESLQMVLPPALAAIARR
jgi:DNA-binding NarL/FixJ family response regulator